METIWLRMNQAMGNNPRRDCFTHKYHALIAAQAKHGFPLPPDVSEQVCRQTESEPLPGYFAMVCGSRGEGEYEQKA